jgi:hypothetical protein
MTRGEAIARLARVDPRASVAVDEFVENGAARHRYRYVNPDGAGVCTIEIDAEPGDLQVAELVKNLPIPADRRSEAAAIMSGRAPVAAPR